MTSASHSSVVGTLFPHNFELEFLGAWESLVFTDQTGWLWAVKHLIKMSLHLSFYFQAGVGVGTASSSFLQRHT